MVAVPDEGAASTAAAAAAGPYSTPQGVGYGFKQARLADGLSVIAELKRRSPSASDLSADADAAELACQYRDGGAACPSVQTDETPLRRIARGPPVCPGRVRVAVRSMKLPMPGSSTASALVAASRGSKLQAALPHIEPQDAPPTRSSHLPWPVGAVLVDEAFDGGFVDPGGSARHTELVPELGQLAVHLALRVAHLRRHVRDRRSRYEPL